MKFKDRIEAGQLLASKLLHYKHDNSTLVVALPRGGVPVAGEIVRLLHLPIDILVVHKIGAPFNPEYAIGAVASGGSMYLDMAAVQHLGLSEIQIDALISETVREVLERERLYLSDREKISPKGKKIILVDDGIATGATIRAAILYLRQNHAKKIIIAVPVCPADVYKDLREKVDRFVYFYKPKSFSSVSNFYENFPQVTDNELFSYL